MKTLTLKPRAAKLGEPPPTPADPAKIGLAQSLGLRFISRRGRYILQTRMVLFEAPDVVRDSTWVDIPLVPEVYG
jgi:hypothetical protein